jgi:Flp pilus assembly protein TadG
MSRRKRIAPRRRGMATMWLIAAGPALLALLVLVTEIGNLWLAKIELHNAAEAGALAGAKVWGSGLDNAATRSAARVAAKAFAEANTVTGATLTISTNDDGGGGNLICPGSIMLGSFTAGVLDETIAAPIPAGQRACRVQATIQVPSLWTSINGPFPLQASATARYDSISGTPTLVSVTSIVCGP